MAGESVDIVVNETGADQAAQNIQAIGEAADAAAAKLDTVTSSTNFLKDAAASTTSPLQEMTSQIAASEGMLRAQQQAADRAGISLTEFQARGAAFAAGADVMTNSVQTATSAIEGMKPPLDDVKDKLDKHQAAEHGAAQGAGEFHEAINLLQEVLVSLGVALSVDKVIQYGEAWEHAGIQLQSVATNVKEASELQHQLLAVSNETGSAFEANVSAFQKLRVETKGMNIESSQLVNVIKDVNAAVKLSGGSSDDAARAIDIFSRALATGQVEGRQFRLLLREFPALGQLVSEGLGKTAAELVKTGQTAATTSKDFIDGFTKAGDAVADQAKKMELTLGQSLQVLKNDLLAYIGEMNESTHATSLLAGAVQFIAEHFNAFATGARVALTVLGSYLLVMQIIPGAFNLATTAVKLFTAALAANPIGLLIVAITTAIALIYQFGSAIKLNADGSITLLGALVGAFNFVVQKVQELWTWLSQYLLPVWGVIQTVALAAIQPIIDVFKALIDVLATFLPSLQAVSDELTKMSTGLVQAMKDASKATQDTGHALTDFGNTAKNTANVVAGANEQMKNSTEDAMSSMDQEIDKLSAEYEKLAFTTQNAMGQVVKYLNETDLQSGRLFNDIVNGAQKAESALKGLSSSASGGGGSSGGGSGGGGTTGSRQIGGSFDQVFQDDPFTILKYFHAAGGKNDDTVYAGIAFEQAYGTIGAIAAAIKFSKLLAGESDAAKNVIKAEMPNLVSELASTGLPGFYNGGSFFVPGQGGQDSQLVQFMATPGEKVTVQTPEQLQGTLDNGYNRGRKQKPVVVNMKVVTPDANSFRRSQNHTLLQLRSKLNNAGRF